MARTPPAQAFGELDQPGEWAGFLSEQGDMIVAPAFVQVEYSSYQQGGSSVGQFLVTSITTHASYAVEDRVRVIFNGFWLVAAKEIDSWNLDQDNIVPHKDQDHVYYLHAEWRESLPRSQIVGFDPVKMTTLATPTDALPVPSLGRFVLAGILQSGASAPKKKGNAGLARTVTVALGVEASWASVAALLKLNALAALLLRDDIVLMPPDLFGAAAALYPSATYDTGKTVRKERVCILRSGADPANGFSHVFGYVEAGQDTTKYAFCATDGQLAAGGFVEAFAAYTPQQLRSRQPSLNKALDQEWALRSFANFEQELILSNESVRVPFGEIGLNGLRVNPNP